MIYSEENISDADFSRITALHLDSLQTSLFSILGPRILESYYRWVVTSKEEVLFLLRDSDGVISAVCLLSLSPETLQKRYARGHLPILLSTLAIKVLYRKDVRSKLFSILFDDDQSPSAVADLPEVVQIYTASERRGEGLGKRLLSDVERYLSQGGFRKYFLKTLDSKDNQALHFYEKRSFRYAGDGGTPVKPYRFFVKELVNPV